MSLRQVTNRVRDLQQHCLSYDMIPSAKISPMVLHETSDSRPTFFAPYPAALLPTPDDDYDREHEKEYCDFGSIEARRQTPINCASIFNHYFIAYIYHYIWLGKYNAGDIPWTPIRYYVPGLPH